MAIPNHDNTHGAPAREIYVEDKKTNWLAWAALVAGLLALFFFVLNRSNGSADRTTTAATVAETTPTEVAAVPIASADVQFISSLGAYLAGSEATPRTFAFEKLNFNSGKGNVRAADRAEVASIVASLRDSAAARIRIVGYADARGDSAANAALGKARTENVKAALIGSGIAAARNETASGGEADPVNTNATAGGQAANRRTQIVVLSR